MTLKSRIAKIAVLGLVSGIILFDLVANTYIPFRYAAVMPRSPQPEAGRIYRVTAQYGAMVYVNKQELARYNFITKDLMILSAVCMFSAVLLGMRLGWFPKRTR